MCYQSLVVVQTNLAFCRQDVLAVEIDNLTGAAFALHIASSYPPPRIIQAREEMKHRSVMLKRSVSVTPVLLLASVLALSACSSDDDDNSNMDMTESNEVLPAALLARSAINNGYYLSRTESFGSDGTLFGGYAYTLNSAESRIEGRSLDDEAVIESLYRYDETGDMASVSFLSTSDALAPLGEEIQRIDIGRANGVLQTISVDYLVGNEEDAITTFAYNSAGRITGATTEYAQSNVTEVLQYNYESGVLVSVIETDVEVPGLTITNTITRDAQGRVSTVSPSYDPPELAVGIPTEVYLYNVNGNVSEIQFQTDDGTVTFREVYTYEATSETVFNLSNYNIYFSQ